MSFFFVKSKYTIVFSFCSWKTLDIKAYGLDYFGEFPIILEKLVVIQFWRNFLFKYSMILWSQQWQMGKAYWTLNWTLFGFFLSALWKSQKVYFFQILLVPKLKYWMKLAVIWILIFSSFFFFRKNFQIWSHRMQFIFA